MRPVNKGKAPDVKFKKYQEAEPYLEKRIGIFCSFCEFPIQHVPEVEHKEAKAEGGDELEWENLLLSCKYCNTRKGKIVKKGEKDKYLWPDEDDTFHVYSYKNGIPELNTEYLKSQRQEITEKAENTYQLVNLRNIPKPGVRDRRFATRIEAYNCANVSLETWKTVNSTEYKEYSLKQIIQLAKAVGFFSVWMEVFSDYEEVQRNLIVAFPGTKEKYCLKK